jgi:hypothetical protein
MEQLRDKIGDIPLCELAMPGSHDSATYGEYPFSSVAKTQSLTIKEQLIRGIRYFDLRVRVHNGVFYAHHGPVGTENHFTDILTDIRDFLREEPGELVVLQFSDFDQPASEGITLENILNVKTLRFTLEDHRRFVQLIKTTFEGMLIPSTSPPSSLTLNKVLPKQIIAIYAPTRVLMRIEGDQAILGTLTYDSIRGFDGDLLLWSRNALKAPYGPPKIGYPFTEIGTGGDGTGVETPDIQALTTDLKKGLLKRPKDKFYVVQGIFEYLPIPPPGPFSSLMEYGAQLLNGSIASLYKDWSFAGRKPNILMTDFVQYGNVVETVLDVLHNRAAPPQWRGGPASDGWLAHKGNWHMQGGAIDKPSKYITAVWVRKQGTFGLVDIAPVYSDSPKTSSPYTERRGSVPPDLDWHFRHWYSGVDDISIQPIPDGTYVTGMDVVDQDSHGLVNLRLYHSGSSEPTPWYRNDTEEGPVCWGPKAGKVGEKRVRSIETRTEGGYGIVDLRYSLVDVAR